MNDEHKNNPLHGITLKTLLNELVEYYGWETLSEFVNIHCFQNNPSINSCLKFLRKTPWAREKVEKVYLAMKKNNH
ncbi:VF530 family protein [Sulfurovum sp.]|uniref:VF530 family protein n=1 Tax=Sulfurovum sp. TaxID=1969726 RepID=UPI0025D9506C|nr:VF530 family protein [Sulfurovum sp.]